VTGEPNTPKKDLGGEQGSPVSPQPQASQGQPNYGIKDDFPLLWVMAEEFDFAERLGRSASALHAEVDAALHELWDARRNVAAVPRGRMAAPKSSEGTK
jgi:hypothetical protein